MSRSSSASSLPDPGYGSYRGAPNGGPRHLDDLRYFDSGYQQPMTLLRPPRHTVDNFHRAPQPAFFVLKEEIRSRSVPAHGSHGQGPRGLDWEAENRIPSPCFQHAVPLIERTSNASGTHSPFIEQTMNGLSLASDDGESESLSELYQMGNEVDDDEAAAEVQAHFKQYRRRQRNSKAGRILKSLICPKSPGADFDLDNEALWNIFIAANDIFFNGSLTGRVRWDWSDQTSMIRQQKIIGTTALRPAEKGGYETLIVLSQEYLRDTKKYNRRLLISTFLHELIHSYLFVRCGFQAKRCGGHTEGFRAIASLIDEWAGPGTLFLSNMEADLDNFPPTTMYGCGYHGSVIPDVQALGEGHGTRQTISTCIWSPDLRLLDQEDSGGTRDWSNNMPLHAQKRPQRY
jgi:hypothetical protein